MKGSEVMLRKISKNIRRRIAKTLAAAFVVGCPLSASAMETYSIGWDGKQIFDVQYYGADDKDEMTASFFGDGDIPDYKILTYNLSQNLKDGLNKAFMWWAEILAPGAVINQPAQYFVGTYTKQNAEATSVSKLNGTQTHNPDLFAEIFQKGRVVPYYPNLYEFLSADTEPDEYAYGFIRIGTYIGADNLDGNFGWVNWYHYALPVPQALKSVEIAPVMFHEIGHSLGIVADRNENHPYAFIYGGKYFVAVGDGASNPYNLTSHLRNQNGLAPQANQLIMTTEDFYNPEIQNAFLAATGRNLTAEDVFIVENVDPTVRQGRTYLYFVGDNVTEALGGKTFTRFDGVQVSGIPINLWEGSTKFPEFSHLELARSMMSHQNYRSYTTFMEAELALLQDIGYNIDRKNFYGRSIYLDNQNIINDQGFSARANGQYVDGYNSSTLGVGLHVYGSNNNVVQRANIWTNGYGAAGIRVDGNNDTIIVPQGTEIHSDGHGGTGILVAYGKNHNIVVDGTVTANSESGDAVHFEFGANVLGGATEYRGSYIRYRRVVNDLDGKIYLAQNLDIDTVYSQLKDDFSFNDLVNGDLNAPMASLTVNGRLEAQNNSAIHISEESFVDRIDINKGAEVIGDIESVWKQFDKDAYGIYDTEQTPTYTVEETDADGNVIYTTDTGYIEPLYIQYNGKNYVYDRYIPDLVTQLNFNAADGEIFYGGNIYGYDNMKMNVTSGTLYYGGAANVVNVNVFNGANLFGGTYTLYDMTERMAEGFSDFSTGKFINHGKISATTINGDLFSDGTLQGVNGYSNANIIVNGAAYVDGSTAQAVNMLPGETTPILAAANVTGNLRNAA
ncbi:MAG: hypothetical protein SR1Q7_12850, partial [Quinella sp. 1Q7]|nr:hypothetical protein [Quinella sp. 1Q7]